MKKQIGFFAPRLVSLGAVFGSESSRLLRRYERALIPHKNRTPLDTVLGTFRSCGLLFPTNRKTRRIRALYGTRQRPLVIVGSGSSLNRLTEAESALINKSDILTFNLSLLAEVRPTYHVFQPALRRLLGSDERERELDSQTEFAKNIVQTQSDKFSRTTFFSQRFSTWSTWSGTPSVLRTMSKSHDIYALPQVYLTAPYPLGLIPTCELFKSEIQSWGDGGATPIIKFGSTVPAMIALGIKLGYRRICLVGCDLLDETHFYDSEPFSSRYQLRERFPHWYEGREGSFFRQNLIDTTSRGTSQDEDIVEFVQWLSNLGVDVRLINHDSILAGRMQTVNDEFFSRGSAP